MLWNIFAVIGMIATAKHLARFTHDFLHQWCSKCHKPYGLIYTYGSDPYEYSEWETRKCQYCDSHEIRELNVLNAGPWTDVSSPLPAK
ncbi:MAG TPA: hypothetical protein VJJ72_01305 [Candidatus Paceibacterota bacterium]